MNYIKFTDYNDVKDKIMDKLRLWVREGRLEQVQALELTQIIYDVELVGDYEIFSKIRDELDEGRYI